MAAPVARIWEQVGTGVPTLLEVAGLPDPEAADIDLPLMQAVELLAIDVDAIRRAVKVGFRLVRT
ncbi:MULTISPECIES: hypothetical protein [Nocardia]|uniref:Uncharacterized protein n=1 Tax=Nocardia elegans TaxID=300029 RepID=A0ABW6TGH8_9NOCA|nr:MULTISPECIES: hypothetical protein [Nocardia]